MTVELDDGEHAAMRHPQKPPQHPSQNAVSEAFEPGFQPLRNLRVPAPSISEPRSRMTVCWGLLCSSPGFTSSSQRLYRPA